MEAASRLNITILNLVVVKLAQQDVRHALLLHHALVVKQNTGLMDLIVLHAFKTVILVRLTQHVQLAQLLIY